MAEEEPILTNPPTKEMAVHVRDYDAVHAAVQIGRARSAW